MAEAGATVDNDGSWWVPMPSGVKFYPERPDPNVITIQDIAQKLAQQCRYGGGTTRFYSVAEHCVLLSYVRPTDNEVYGLYEIPDYQNLAYSDMVLRFQREALMHDRAEAWLQDFIRPLKNKCQPWYGNIESKLEEVSAPLFGLLPHPPKLVMDYDYRICIDEKRQGIACPYEAHNKFEETEPLGVTLQFLTPEQAMSAFLHRFHELYPNAEINGWSTKW